MVVGLGNPGSQYEATPHNLGFLTVDRLAERHRIRVSRKENQSLVGLGWFGAAQGGTPVGLVKPQTFMNVNGPAVKALMDRYAVGAANLIAVYDELDLPWGALRIRVGGSAGGHNGVKSLIGAVKTDRFTRVRMGIHPGHPLSSGAKYVLEPFRRSQLQDVAEMVDRAADAVETIVAEGAEKAMTKHNRRAPGLKTEEE